MSTANVVPVSTASSGPLDRRWTWLERVALVLLLALGLWVRVKHVDAAPSFDELWHLRLSAAKGLPLQMYPFGHVYLHPQRPTSLIDAPPIWRVWTSMDGVLHPPLYVLTLRVWRDLLGDGNRVAQAYSMLWGLVSIGFTFAAARLAMNGTMACLVGLTMVLAPTQVYFAQEIRAYAMLSGLSAVAIWQMTRIEVLGATRGRARALALMTLPLMLTHYFAAGAAVGIAVYGLSRLNGHRRAFIYALLIAAGVYAVTWLPFATQQLDDLGSGDVSWKTPTRDLVHELVSAASAPFRLIVDRSATANPIGLVGGILFVLPWLLVRRLPALVPWACMLVGGIATLVLLDMARSTQLIILTRYLASAGPAVVLVLAGCGWAARRWAGVAIAGSAAMMALVNLYAGVWVDLDIRSFGSVVGYLSPRIASGVPIVVVDDMPSYSADGVLEACSNDDRLGQHPFLSLDRPASVDTQRALGRYVWLILDRGRNDPTQVFAGARVLSQAAVEPDMQVCYLELPVVADSTRPTSLLTASPRAAATTIGE